MHLLTAPTAEPVTLDQAKLAARISDTSAFDATVPGLITAARQLAEQITGRQLMAQTWRTELADWPAASDVLPIHQATSATAAYWTGSAWAAVDGAAFSFAPVGNGTALAPTLGTSWPVLVDKAVGARVRIDLTAGAADAAAVPECVKLFIKALVAYWIDTPGATAAGSLAEAPFLRSLLDPAKIY
jgi:uncharacterized phiE125 gp8 family phage protein